MANKLNSAPPFRAEHLGSLLRPDNLLEAREKIANTGISAEAAGLPAIEQEAVREVVKMQQDLGFKAVTSGEYNRTRFWGLMWDEFQGKWCNSAKLYLPTYIYIYIYTNKQRCKENKN